MDVLVYARKKLLCDDLVNSKDQDVQCMVDKYSDRSLQLQLDTSRSQPGARQALEGLMATGQDPYNHIDITRPQLQDVPTDSETKVEPQASKNRMTYQQTKLQQTEVSELPDVLTYSLPLKWKKTIKMSSGVVTAQAVFVGGKVYIGGNKAECGMYKILEYTVEESLWKVIETPVRRFGMAEVNGQVIIAGGHDRGTIMTNQVWVLDSLTNRWTQPFPAMPTARLWPSAVGYKRWVLVVGGFCKTCVEVLDTKLKQWYTASSLPRNALQPSLAVIQDTLYVVRKFAVSVSIPMLISDAIFQSQSSHSTNESRPPVWQLLPDTLTSSPTVISFHGYLLAVGAAWRSPSSTIAMYLPHTEQWQTVAQLPTPRGGCTCVVLPKTEELMVIGGLDERKYHIKIMDVYQ